MKIAPKPRKDDHGRRLNPHWPPKPMPPCRGHEAPVHPPKCHVSPSGDKVILDRGFDRPWPGAEERFTPSEDASKILKGTYPTPFKDALDDLLGP